ncbi:MAG: hypothetical protein AAGA68_15345 [Pseudomonadota bacterium]
MGEAELERLWQGQRAPSSMPDEAINQVLRMREQRRLIMAAMAAAGAAALLALGLRAVKLLADPTFTWLNGSVELLLGALPLICVVAVAVQRQRRHRELEALSLNTQDCVAFVHGVVRQEIRDIRAVAPSLLVAFLGLFAVSKWQSITSGREALSHEWLAIALVLGAATVTVAVLYHRLSGLLLPRLAYLARVRAALDRVG